METPLDLAATNPLPYLSMAYGIGLVVIVTYVIFLLRQRSQLRALQQTLDEES